MEQESCLHEIERERGGPTINRQRSQLSIKLGITNYELRITNLEVWKDGRCYLQLPEAIRVWYVYLPRYVTIMQVRVQHV